MNKYRLQQLFRKFLTNEIDADIFGEMAKKSSKSVRRKLLSLKRDIINENKKVLRMLK